MIFSRPILLLKKTTKNLDRVALSYTTTFGVQYPSKCNNLQTTKIRNRTRLCIIKVKETKSMDPLFIVE